MRYRHLTTRGHGGVQENYARVCIVIRIFYEGLVRGLTLNVEIIFDARVSIKCNLKMEVLNFLVLHHGPS